MNAATLSDATKKKEWIRFLKANPPEYRVACLRAVLRCDGEGVLRKCLQELGWEKSFDMIAEVESDPA